MCLRVANIKQRLTHLWVVQEETTAEVKDGFFGFRQELVGDKRHLIARLAEIFREQRIVAPISLLSYHMHGEQVLEYKTGEVPGGYNIRELDQLASALPFYLSGCRRLLIAIQLGMVFVVTFTDDKHNGRAAERAAVNRQLRAGSLQLVDLLRSQMVAEGAEPQTVDRCIEFRVFLCRQLVFHLSDGLFGKHLRHLCLVVGGSYTSPYQQTNDRQT